MQNIIYVELESEAANLKETIIKIDDLEFVMVDSSSG